MLEQRDYKNYKVSKEDYEKAIEILKRDWQKIF